MNGGLSAQIYCEKAGRASLNYRLSPFSLVAVKVEIVKE